MRRRKRCQRTHVCSSTRARTAPRSCDRYPATAASSARTRIGSARRSRPVSRVADCASTSLAPGSCGGGRIADPVTTTSRICRGPYVGTSSPSRTRTCDFLDSGCGRRSFDSRNDSSPQGTFPNTGPGQQILLRCRQTVRGRTPDRIPHPPSTSRVCPVIQPASLETSHATAAAISPCVPQRAASGICAATLARLSSSA